MKALYQTENSLKQYQKKNVSAKFCSNWTKMSATVLPNDKLKFEHEQIVRVLLSSGDLKKIY